MPRRLIAHVSDLHCGSPYFQPSLLSRAIDEINEMQADIVVVSGDLTAEGFKADYESARDYIHQFECENVVVIPGNHDSRNVGYLHFEDMFGERNAVLERDGVTVVAVDSTEPDVNEGKIGRGRYRWIAEQFARPADLRIFVLHHHLIPIPGTGRERSVVADAGDTLQLLQNSGVDLVLSGHKHVPYAWQLENLFIVNAGTVSTTRLRGRGRPCYNIIELDGDTVQIDQKFPYHGREPVIRFSRTTREFHKYLTSADAALVRSQIEGEGPTSDGS